MEQNQRTCKECHTPFTVRPQDIAFYQKIDVPFPTLCPTCRYRRRLINRNEWSLYRRTCDGTGQTIVSIYHEGVPFPVYKQDYWWSDAWDGLSYGREIDFSRPFFEQFNELSLEVPHLALVNFNSVNSEYTNQSESNKDCYMLSASGQNEKCMYGNWFQLGCYFSADCYSIEKSELCYECSNCARCYGCTFSQDLSDCTSCHFSLDLRGCSDCFGCTGLRNKQHCFFNEQLTKEEYQARLAAFEWSRASINEMRQKAYQFSLGFPRKFYHGAKNISSSGDYIENNGDTQLSFNCRHNKDVAYSQDAWKMKDAWDMTEILYAELAYECQGCLSPARSIALRSCFDVHDSYYSDMCFGSSDLFGCMGLRQKHYCILNKQYPKEEYLKLKEKLVEHMKKTGEWGEYYPASISSFGYNESVAQEYFPLHKEEAQEKGYQWFDRPDREIHHTKSVSELSRTIAEVDDGILKEVIQCSSQETPEGKEKYTLCAVAYTIVPLELEFYRKMNLPLPEKCFPCRRQDRFALRNPRSLWERQCQCGNPAHSHGITRCPETFTTTYAPSRSERIFCEQCYVAEVA